jgi:FlaA1/EpsC-like NDP-sugar epimerase
MHRFHFLLGIRNQILGLEGLSRPSAWIAQTVIFLTAGLLAFLLRFDFQVPAFYRTHLLVALCVWVAAKTIVFFLLKMDRGWLTQASLMDLYNLLLANLLATGLSSLLILAIAPAGFPRSVYILDFVLCFLATSAARVTLHIVQDLLRRNGEEGSTRVLIYGAGSAGALLLREIELTPSLHYHVCGFIDDNPTKQGLRFGTLCILGSGRELATLVPEFGIDLVLIAIPSATGDQMCQILNSCHAAGVLCKTIPPVKDFIEGHALTSQMREVDVVDLLGRSPIVLDEELIRAKLQGRVVLVTGAAGSIGSELCRRIARWSPHRIVGLDVAETPLFFMEKEMRERFPQVPFSPEIGSIQSPHRLAEIFSKHSPSVVYHAAAYKHVPMMEMHCFEAIENNVFGTWNLARAALVAGVEDFVMISTDKAVRPTSLMGASKRVAELLIHSLRGEKTNFVSVRFGNVLGSNGSVVPIFKAQIAAGGPVTVTHPDMRRFFMTIPEAAQLVLQASTMGHGGEIFVLEMGDPVRIVDLARKLITLSGLRPDDDIRIEFTGVRPGEKLYEELNDLYEDTLPTRHPKIRIFAGNGLVSPTVMDAYLDDLRAICRSRETAQLVLTLKDVLPDYNPSASLLRRAVANESPRSRHAVAASA